MLTGKEIAQRQIITNFLDNNIQQQGIDVRVKNIKRVGGNVGIIPAGNIRKTTTPDSQNVYKLKFNEVIKRIVSDGWYLEPGYYEVEYDEGCNIPEDCCMQFKSRSSLVRCGGEVRSGLFDAGFHTDNMGSFLKVELPMFIEEHARIAQVIVDSSNKVDNLYNGQWQGDNQRNA